MHLCVTYTPNSLESFTLKKPCNSPSQGLPLFYQISPSTRMDNTTTNILTDTLEEQLLIEISYRLLTKSLYRFQCVSKTKKKLIVDALVGSLPTPPPSASETAMAMSEGTGGGEVPLSLDRRRGARALDWRPLVEILR